MSQPGAPPSVAWPADGVDEVPLGRAISVLATPVALDPPRRGRLNEQSKAALPVGTFWRSDAQFWISASTKRQPLPHRRSGCGRVARCRCNTDARILRCRARDQGGEPPRPNTHRSGLGTAMEQSLLSPDQEPRSRAPPACSFRPFTSTGRRSCRARRTTSMAFQPLAWRFSRLKPRGSPQSRSGLGGLLTATSLFCEQAYRWGMNLLLERYQLPQVRQDLQGEQGASQTPHPRRPGLILGPYLWTLPYLCAAFTMSSPWASYISGFPCPANDWRGRSPTGITSAEPFGLRSVALREYRSRRRELPLQPAFVFARLSYARLVLPVAY